MSARRILEASPQTPPDCRNAETRPGWLTEIRTLEKWLAVPLPGAAAGCLTQSHRARNSIRPSAVRSLPAPRTSEPAILHPIKPGSRIANSRRTRGDCDCVAESFLRFKNRQILLKTYSEKLFDSISAASAKRTRAGIAIGCASLAGSIARTAAPSPVPADGRHSADRRRGHASRRPATADRARILSDQPRRSPLLGRYEKGLETDIENRGTSGTTRQSNVRSAQKWTATNCPRRPLMSSLARLRRRFRAAVKRLNESFVAWSHLTHELLSILPHALCRTSGRPSTTVLFRHSWVHEEL